MTGRRLAAVIALWVLLAGCASLPEVERSALAPLPERALVDDAPFFPQTLHHCGPAALAGVLTWSGARTDPQALAPMVYLPGREGSLQVEMTAAVRRFGRVPYPLAPQLDALLAEVAAGHPVLVLQNLGLSWYPRWHYAVVVGYDRGRGEALLDSGIRHRYALALGTFLHTWERAGRWGLVVMPPGQLPATAEQQPWLRAVAVLEEQGRLGAAGSGYRAALMRWPQSLVARLGIGNILYTRGDLDGARRSFSRAVSEHPDSAAAHNNLAVVLAGLGDTAGAEREAERALALGGPAAAEARRTLKEIRRRR